jgi:hypothetical protein
MRDEGARQVDGTCFIFDRTNMHSLNVASFGPVQKASRDQQIRLLSHFLTHSVSFTFYLTPPPPSLSYSLNLFHFLTHFLTHSLSLTFSLTLSLTFSLTPSLPHTHTLSLLSLSLSPGSIHILSSSIHWWK